MTRDMTDHPPARFVRQYALTQGRARSVGLDLPLDALVETTKLGVELMPRLTGEQLSIVTLASEPLSIAEISAHLHVHLGVARVLVSDLVAHELVAVSAVPDDDGPDLNTLERLLVDLNAL